MSDFLQVEDSTYLLQEIGDKIILVFIPAPPAVAVAKVKSGYHPADLDDLPAPVPEPVILIEPNLIIRMRT